MAEPLQSFPSQIIWTSQRQKSKDPTLDPDWGDGETLYLTFTVEDTGPGMTIEELGRIFDRFEQATPRTSIKYGGSGLGLFISHSLTEKQYGRIGATSRQASGTTFAFYIKARNVRAGKRQLENGVRLLAGPKPLTIKDVGKSAELVPLSKVASNLHKSTSPCTFHLLLVEDNLINQRVLRKQLSKTGCTVHVANHGIEALTFLRTSSLWTENKGEGPHLDAVLMDWEMPVMDGLTCTREIRSLETLGQFAKHPEVIAITANVRQEQIRTAEEAGVDAVVPKPFVVSELLEMITNRLNGGC